VIQTAESLLAGEDQHRSPDEALRSPGFLDFASLHPGYGFVNKTFVTKIYSADSPPFRANHLIGLNALNGLNETRFARLVAPNFL